MSILSFDTYAAVTRLREAGFSEAQANCVVDTFRELDTSDVATGTDIRELELRMTIKLGGLIVAATGILIAAIRYLPPGHS